LHSGEADKTVLGTHFDGVPPSVFREKLLPEEGQQELAWIDTVLSPVISCDWQYWHHSGDTHF